MKKIGTQLLILIIIGLIIVPVAATGQNISNTSVAPTVNGTGTEVPATLLVTPDITATTPENSTTIISTTIISEGTTLPPTAVTAVPVLSLTTAIPSSVPVTQISGGNITVASSPMGASILIDGVFYGVTPGNITGISAGNHIMRLTLSGYYDYEGTFSVVPGEVTNVFGTLPPLSGSVTRQQTATPTPAVTVIPVTSATVQPTQTSSDGIFANPTVLAAIIGVITACIGATATIIPHLSKLKKE